MKKVSALLTILSLLSPTVYAEPTPTGAQPTFVTPDGQGHTYYDINGNALPMGTQIFLGLDGRGGSILDASGNATGQMAYDSTERAQYWKNNVEQAGQQATAGFVAGPAVFGPVGAGGSSSSSIDASAVAYDESAYNEVNYELVVLIYGANEIGAKSCKGVDGDQPASLSNWWKAIKTYTAAEAKRDLLLRDRVNFMQGKLQALTESKGQSKELQIEAIQAQIDLLNASIDSLAGSSFYNADGKGGQSSGNGRIPIREKLILAALDSNDKNSTENNKNVKTYKETLIENGLSASLKVAEEACQRKAKVKERTCETVHSFQGRGEASETLEEVCTEVEKEVSDPVPGCDVVKSTIPELRSGPVQVYGEIYLLPRIPSKEINDKMGKLEVTIESKIAGLPKSDDPKYDWSTPMENGIKEMISSRKKAGAICPGNSKESVSKAIAEAVSNNIKNPEMIPAGIAVAVASFAGDTAAISKSSAGFLMAMGFASSEEKANEFVNPKPLKEGEQAPLVKPLGQVASENFIEAWNAVDQVIGQAGNRGTYFGEISNKATQLLAMDKSKLSELMTQKTKLEKYLAELKKALAAPNTTKPALANNPASSTPTKSSVQLGANKVTTIGTAGITESSGQTIKVGSSQNAALLDAAQFKTVSVGGPANPKIDFGYTALPNGSLVKNSLGLSSNAVANANKLNSNALANNKKTKDMLTQTFTSPTAGTTGSNKVSTFQDSMNGSFTKLKKQAGSGELYKTAAIASPFDINGDGVKTASDAASSYGKDGGYSKSYDNDSPYYSGGGTLGGRTTTVSTYSSSRGGSSYDKDKNADSKKSASSRSSAYSSGGARSGYKSEESMKNAKLLADSIKAKRSKNPEQFAADEEDSLFSRVTKAYIRNYEKVEDKSLEMSEE